ncbi:hypothetical protein ACHAW5_009422 [Stephanodiscus triporus]|uniref:Uncharacterized protein n=1 Tax=Stephanodiscus triporus TaxID=2934178 RepID=A0ABD3PW13_9STRA
MSYVVDSADDEPPPPPDIAPEIQSPERTGAKSRDGRYHRGTEPSELSSIEEEDADADGGGGGRRELRAAPPSAAAASMDSASSFDRRRPDYDTPPRAAASSSLVVPRKETPTGASPTMVDMTNDSGDDDVDLLPRGGGADENGAGRRRSTSAPLVASVRRECGGRTTREVGVTVRWVEVEVEVAADRTDRRVGIPPPPSRVSRAVGEGTIAPRGGVGGAADDEGTTTESDEGAARRSTRRGRKRRRGPTSEGRPEFVASSDGGRCTPNAGGGDGGGGPDGDDYAILRTRYLMPRIREKVELAGGITLRRQCRGRMIDQNTPGFRLLRSRVDALTRKRDHAEVYRLLCQLRNWELDPRRVPTAFRDAGDEDVAEVLDLTRDEDERPSCVDVDEYIADVLLAPLDASSGFIPHHTSSSQQPTDACNQRLRKSLSQDAPATAFSDGQQCSPSPTVAAAVAKAGTEKLEAYAHAKDSAMINIGAVSSPSLSPGHRTPMRPRSPANTPTRQCFVAINDYERWNDIPKPPGQKTIHECRDFYVQEKKRPQFQISEDLSMQQTTAGASAPGFLANGGGVKGSIENLVRTPLPSSSISFLENSPDLLQQCGLGEQLDKHTGTAHPFTPRHNFLLSTVDAKLLRGGMPLLQGSVAMPNCYHFVGRGRALQNEIYVPPENTFTQIFSSPLPNLRVDLTPPKLDFSAFTFGALPPSPSNDRTKVSQVVTPEAEEQKPCKKKKQQEKSYINNYPGNNMHVLTRVSTFLVTDFGFPSNQRIPPFSRGACYSAQSVRKDNKRHYTTKTEGTSRQRNPVNCRPTNISRDLKHVRPAFNSITFSVIPASRLLVEESKPVKAKCLREQWNIQSTLRRSGQWTPNGHLTGRWKPPEWAVVQSNDGGGVHNEKKKKHPGCRKSLLPELNSLVLNFAAEMRMSCNSSGKDRTTASLRDVVCPQYVRPTINLLCSAHSAVESLLPKGDCEDWEVVAMAWRYYNHWRPRETKVLLLAESHAFTPKERAYGPGLDKGMLQDTYFGPRGFVSLVYCLSYGENESLSGNVIDKTNKGTSQFWTLFAACARGVEHVADTTAKKAVCSRFASDLLKGGGLSVEERLKAKLEVLEDLRSRGIWLLDASIFGWYMSQPQEYSRSSSSGEVHRKQKNRPPKELKIPSLVLSWELFTKHLIREVSDEGHLKLLIPIGMEVEAALTRERMEDAIRVDSTQSLLDW